MLDSRATMNAQEIDISLILNSSEFLENAMAAAQRSGGSSVPQHLHGDIVSNVMSVASCKEKDPKGNEDKKRERNILSSRKYRAKRKERMKILEETNKHLAIQIRYAEFEVDEMKKRIHKFVRHAATCEECGSLQIRFE